MREAPNDGTVPPDAHTNELERVPTVDEANPYGSDGGICLRLQSNDHTSLDSVIRRANQMGYSIVEIDMSHGRLILSRDEKEEETSTDELDNHVAKYGRTYSTVGDTVPKADGDKRYGLHYDGETDTVTIAAVDMRDLPDERSTIGPRSMHTSFKLDDPGVDTYDLNEVAEDMADGTLLTTLQMKKIVVCDMCGVEKRDVIRSIFGASLDEAHDIVMQPYELEKQAKNTVNVLQGTSE